MDITFKTGPNFANELSAAGLEGAPISWTVEGVCGWNNLSPEQQGLLQAVIDNHDPERPCQDEIERLRKSAYMAEADPLFFLEQRGEIPTGSWLLKIKEIKQRLPKQGA